MNYIGSKYSLVEFIKDSILETLATANETRQPEDMVFADLFAGTCAVGGAFKSLGYKVIANDIQYFSYVLCRHIIGNDGSPDADRRDYLIDALNNTEGAEGFIYKNYSYGGTADKPFRRMYFSDSNAKKCDGMRIELEKWKDENAISENEYYFLLSSLVNSIDKYANTASVYGAFLKKLKKSALKDMVLAPLPSVPGCPGEVYNEDISELVKKISGDILYLDPPYNARQYCTNYHLLETVARYDEPEIYGKTGLREYSKEKSVFCNTQQVSKAFEALIKNANFKYVFLSYNNEGLMSFNEIEKIMKKYGRYKVYMTEHRRFKADNARDCKAKTTVEYLHCLIKK